MPTFLPLFRQALALLALAAIAQLSTATLQPARSRSPRRRA